MATTVTPAPTLKFGAALTYVQNLLGYLVNEIDEVFTLQITNPTVPFIQQNGDRLGLVIVNTSTNPAFIGLSSAVGPSNQGIYLPASGGSISMDARTDFTLPTRAWWGIATGGITVIYVLEIIGVKALPPGAFGGHL